MTENVENIIIEHLKALRNELRTFRDESRDSFMQISARMQSVEERLTLTEKGIANVHGDMALVQLRLDRQSERMERIERRLDLTHV